MTAVTIFPIPALLSKKLSQPSRLSRGAGTTVKGAYLRVEIATRQYNPNPLTAVSYTHLDVYKRQVEKGFQGGGDKLRAAGVNLHSLAIIESAEPGNIVFREEEA